MLVTPQGTWVFPNSDEFFGLLGDYAPDYDAVSFAVKNLGFIKFQISDESIVEIEMHPRNVSMPALTAVQERLLTCRMRLFRLKYLDTCWRLEISSSIEYITQRLSELCTPESTKKGRR